VTRKLANVEDGDQNKQEAAGRKIQREETFKDVTMRQMLREVKTGIASEVQE
jgi:hypothetical protein